MALFGSRVFIEVLIKNLKIKIISEFGWLLNPMAGEETHTQRQREGSHVKREAETGVLPPQAEKHLKPPNPGRDEE